MYFFFFLPTVFNPLYNELLSFSNSSTGAAPANETWMGYPNSSQQPNQSHPQAQQHQHPPPPLPPTSQHPLGHQQPPQTTPMYAPPPPPPGHQTPTAHLTQQQNQEYFPVHPGYNQVGKALVTISSVSNDPNVNVFYWISYYACFHVEWSHRLRPKMVDEHPNTELFWLLADVAITCCILMASRLKKSNRNGVTFSLNCTSRGVE